MNRILFQAILLVAALTLPARAQTTVFVPDDYPTIQAAVDAAAPSGWTILVRPGTYLENIQVFGDRTPGAIVLRSTDGPEVTILDGSQPSDPNEGSVVTMGFGVDLEGFTVTGGTGRDSARYGGGLFLQGNSTVENRIRGCIIENNSARYGGAVMGFTVRVTMEDCELRNNTATWAGGGIWFSEARPLLFRRCLFSQNSAPIGGAAFAADEVTLTFEQCRFQSNTADQGGAFGNFAGGYIESITAIFRDCLFKENSAPHGGAIYGEYFWFLHLDRCTLVANSADQAGIFEICLADTFRVQNSLIWGNTAPWLSGCSTPDVSFSLVEGGTDGTGVLVASPWFVDPSQGDYRLFPGSPGMDAGDPLADPETTDLDGLPRVLDGDRDGAPVLDIGCYEYQPGPYDGRLGNVNTAGGGADRADVLLLNGSAGDVDRRLVVPTGEPLQLDIVAPPSRVSSRHVVYAWLGESDPFTVSVQERAGFYLGWADLPTVFSGGSPSPLKIWSSFGHEPLFGEPDFLPGDAPTTLFSLPDGRPRPIKVTFQGFVEDDAAPNGLGVAVTNAVVLCVE